MCSVRSAHHGPDEGLLVPPDRAGTDPRDDQVEGRDDVAAVAAVALQREHVGRQGWPPGLVRVDPEGEALQRRRW